MGIFSAKAVVAGLATDLICQTLYGVLLIAAAEYALCKCTNMSREQAMVAISYPYVQFAGFSGAILLHIVSGYVAGLLSPERGRIINSLAVGIFISAMGVLAAFDFSRVLSEWKIALSILGPTPAALVGGQLAIWRAERRLSAEQR
jgi:hypothetical protein